MSSVEGSKSWAEFGPSPSAWLFSKAENAGGGGRRLLAGGTFVVAAAAEIPVRAVLGTAGGIKNAFEKVWPAEKRGDGKRRGPSSTLFNKAGSAEHTSTRVLAGGAGAIVVIAEFPTRLVTETLGAVGRAAGRVTRR